MSFNSLVFLIYLVVVLVLYYVLPHKIRWAMLLIASYFFYAYWNFALIFLILTTTLTSYLSGLLMEKTERQGVKNLLLVTTLVVCIGFLVFFKYFNFLSGSVTSLIRLFGGEADDFFLELILPVGISFYTFQTLSYVIDVYRGTIDAEKHIGYFALFVSFFPQLVAGPIERPQDLIPQLKAEHKPDKDNLLQGFKIMAAGFVKKVVVADTLSVYVNAVYNAADLGQVTGLSVLLATVLFVVQIYCDFSGYSDIATGCAKMMGIGLTVNFDRPLSSESLDELWSRWHISLNSWFRDYIYLPLNYRAIGKKHLKARIYLNLLIVFFISGLWHGANWTFVIWGLYNGICQVLEGALKKPKSAICSKFGWTENGSKTRLIRILKTNAILMLGLIMFRSNTVGNAFAFFGKLFSDWSFSAEYFSDTFSLMGMDVVGAVTSALVVAVMFAVDKFIIRTRGKDVLCGEKAACVNTGYIYIIWLIAVAWLFLIANGLSSGFIYFQF